MVSFWDLPDNFYYTDLRSALEDFHISKDGIHQIQTLLPVSDPKDREILRMMLIKLVARTRTRSDVTNLTEEHVSSQLRVLGLSGAAIFQVYYKREPITDPQDRLTLLGALAAGLVRNEAFVPRGLTGPHRMLWKQNQLKKKS